MLSFAPCGWGAQTSAVPQALQGYCSLTNSSARDHALSEGKKPAALSPDKKKPESPVRRTPSRPARPAPGSPYRPNWRPAPPKTPVHWVERGRLAKGPHEPSDPAKKALRPLLHRSDDLSTCTEAGLVSGAARGERQRWRLQGTPGPRNATATAPHAAGRRKPAGGPQTCYRGLERASLVTHRVAAFSGTGSISRL